jgi:hypothetical protein
MRRVAKNVMKSISRPLRLAFWGISAVVIVVLFWIFFWARSGSRCGTINDLVRINGRPDFIATKVTGYRDNRLKSLRVLISMIDPRSVSNWGGISNTFVIWAKSEQCRAEAGLFYEKMSRKLEFYGSGFYGSRSLLGESLEIFKIGAAGEIVASQSIRVNVIAMDAEGYWKPPLIGEYIANCSNLFEKIVLKEDRKFSQEIRIDDRTYESSGDWDVKRIATDHGLEGRIVMRPYLALFNLGNHSVNRIPIEEIVFECRWDGESSSIIIDPVMRYELRLHSSDKRN